MSVSDGVGRHPGTPREGSGENPFRVGREVRVVLPDWEECYYDGVKIWRVVGYTSVECRLVAGDDRTLAVCRGGRLLFAEPADVFAPDDHDGVSGRIGERERAEGLNPWKYEGQP
jgi:hypothetical protein